MSIYNIAHSIDSMQFMRRRVAGGKVAHRIFQAERFNKKIQEFEKWYERHFSSEVSFTRFEDFNPESAKEYLTML